MNEGTHELLTIDAAFFGPTTIKELRPDSTYNEWEGALAFSIKYWKGINWFLADCLNHRWADTEEGNQAIAQMIGIAGLDKALSPQTLLNIKSVGKKFPPEVRNKAPFTYYQEAQALPLPKALEVVQSAESARDIRDIVRATKEGSAGTRSAATVISEEEDLLTVGRRLLNHLEDFEKVLLDPDMNLDQIRLAAKPLLKALREL